MNSIFENFKPEAIFSTGNPIFKSVQKTHSLFAVAFDTTARMQLALAEELLDLNKKRLASLYAGESVKDTIATHKDLLTEAGERTVAMTDELKQVATDFQTGLTDAANGWITVATDAVSNITKTAEPVKAVKTSKKAA